MITLSKNLKLPDDAVTQTFGFIGRKGSGKTYAAGRLVELFLNQGVQTIVLDPVGNWFGLRLDRSGQKPSGLKIPILGGEHGDVPLEHTGGKLVADFIISTGSSVILDVSPFRKGQRKQFVADFAEELFQEKKRNRSPMHLVIEESQVFAPQRTQRGEERMLGAIEDIVRLGRNYGIGCSLISQRPQSVNKEVLNQVEPLIVFQISGSHEYDAIQKWVKHVSVDVDLDELPHLKNGECFFWSPAWLDKLIKTKFSPKRTFDASATPKLGEILPEPQSLKPVDLKSLNSAMAETIEKSKADDPKLLKKRIIELERQASKPVAAPAPVVDEDAIRRAVEQAIEERDIQWRGAYADLAEDVIAEARKIGELFQRIPKRIGDQIKAKPMPEIPKTAPRAQTRTAPAPRSRPVASPHSSNGQTLPRGERAILIACAQYPDGIGRDQLTILTGFKKSTRDRYLRLLQQDGLVESQSGSQVKVTGAGLSVLGDDYEPLPTGKDLLQHWLERLPAGERRILSVVADTYPDLIDRESITNATEYKKSTRDRYLRLLQTRRLVTTESGGVKAADVLFESGGRS